MAATSAQIAELRRYVAEPGDSNGYTNAVLTAIIERYPLLDDRGQEAYTWNTATTPPSQTANTGWIPTYDLYAAAADCWQEKAAAVVAQYDFSADGASYQRSQTHAAMMAQVRFYRSRRRPTSATAVAWPQRSGGEDVQNWIGNMPERD
jgi:hypothetical protein